MEITFLSLSEVIAIHETQIHRFGGSLGIRDQGLLEAAVNMPQATFGGQFLHDGLQAMAAAYLFHLVANHPFIDGNKRVGGVGRCVSGHEPLAPHGRSRYLRRVRARSRGQPLGEERCLGIFPLPRATTFGMTVVGTSPVGKPR